VSIVLAVVAIVGVAACAVGWRRASARVARLEARVNGLEREVRDVHTVLDRARRYSEEAIATARRAADAAGVEDPPPRLVAEAITGPVVRAVAFGAGARRALVRFTTDVAPLNRTRRVVAFTTKRRGLDSKRGHQKSGDAKAERRAG
jgi:hypothetical protein